MESIHTVESHWVINVILQTLHPLLHKIPQTTEESDSYYSGPSLEPTESRNKTPPVEKVSVVTSLLQK